MNKHVLLLLLFFNSCKEKPNSSRPLEFLSRVDYSRTIHLIIGSDTQAVNETYNKYYKDEIYSYPTLSGHATFQDSILLEWHLRKYYVNKDLEERLNDYMLKTSNQIIDSSCSDVYEFTYNTKKGKPALYCMHSLEEANNYYNGLKKIIEESNGDSFQSKIILLDLKFLINKRNFTFSLKQKQMILSKGNTPKEKEKMQDLVDTMEFFDRKERRKIQDK